MKKTQEKKLAKLTPAEDRRWVQLFSWGANVGYSTAKASREAWAGLLEEFPRLRAYDGALVD